MNILYGVVGEGMGHATRSEAVIRHLLACGHKLVILASGKAEPYLRTAFAGCDAAQVDAIRGSFIRYDGNAVDRSATVLAALKALPTAAVVNFAELKKLNASAALPEQAFDAVVTDFETLAHLYGKLKRLPVINIDNMSIITRCDHRALDLPARTGFDRAVAAMITEGKVLASSQYLITTFFYPPLRDRCRTNTRLVPPILRDEIFATAAALRRGEIPVGDEVLVYHTSATFAPLLAALDAAGVRGNVYGFDPAAYAGRYRHLTLKPRGREPFFTDFARAAAVITGGGFSLISEAVHLGKPVLSLPLAGQFEQQLNARYLEQLGYGMHADGDAVTADPAGFRARLDAFLANLPRYRANLAQYATEHPQADNTAVFAALDELLAREVRS
ncbi:MAG TPA: glycosyltransferase family protein [bacterium]|nr:glycosyltransferase family protein [bacterium]